MNDIQKLDKVISTLEDRATEVSEFNGLLSAVNETKKQIELSQEQFKGAMSEHKKLVLENSKNFNIFEKRLASFEGLLDEMARTQSRMSANISALDIVSPKAFSKGLDSTEKTIVDHLQVLEKRVETINEAQQRRIRKSNLLLLLSAVAVLGAVFFFGLV